jgi:hypothetical protein
MKIRTLKSLWILLFLPVILFAMPVFAQDDNTGREATIAEITAPVDGAVIPGTVTIIGSAGHPTQFNYYTLEFRNLDDPNRFWLPITQAVTQSAINEILGVWDTRSITSGNFEIRLLVYLLDPDEEPVEFVVTNIRIENVAPSPLPTIQPSPTFGVIASPEITQPPLVTPIPSPRPSANFGENTTEDETSFSLNFDRLVGAFCNGVIIAFVFFGFIGGYLMMRTRLRPMARQFMWQIRSEREQNYDRDEYR